MFIVSPSLLLLLLLLKYQSNELAREMACALKGVRRAL